MKKKKSLNGVGVALVTPFKTNKKIDYEGLERLLKHVTTGGVDYLVVQGTTGESPTLANNEKKTILEFIKKHNSKNLPIVYGIGGNNTLALLKKIKKTDLEEVDAVLSVSPYYNKPSQEGIYQHYRTLADACPVPIILYNVPSRTGSNISSTTTLRLAQHPNIIGTKEASGNIGQCMEIIKHKPKDFFLTSGEDGLTVPMMSVGSVGVISVLGNAFPKIFSQMVNAASKGNYKKAKSLSFMLLELNSLMYVEGNPTGIKQVLSILGVCENHVRLPNVVPSLSLTEDIESYVQAILDENTV